MDAPKISTGKVIEMKKFLSLLMALAMTLSLAACGSTEDTTTDTDDTQDNAAEELSLIHI